MCAQHRGSSQEGTRVRQEIDFGDGRQLEELQEVFPDYAIFDRIVAENGAVLYRPSSKDCKVLAAAPPPEFVDELRRGECNHLLSADASWLRGIL